MGDTAAYDGGRFSSWRIRAVRRLDEGFFLLTLDGLTGREGAEKLRSQCLYAYRDDLPQLAEDEVYVADLIGCRVSATSGQDIGVAVEVQDVAGSSLLVVERPGRAAALVPLVPSILIQVDLDARVITIDPPEGLLDLDAPGLMPSSPGEGESLS